MIDPEVLEYYLDQLQNNNYNPAARYLEGIKAASSIQNALEQMAEILHCDPDELIVTSGATESINTALKGIAFSPNPKHQRILTTAAEHAATSEVLKYLKESDDFQIDQMDLDAKGLVKVEQFAHHLKQHSYDLITAIYVNNVTGAILPVKELTDSRNRLQPSVPIHLDAVQALGKIPLNLTKLGIELASFSLHKIGAPKGIGLLYKAKNTRILPLLHGGGQQHQLRSGTENPALVNTAAFAMARAYHNLEKTNRHLRSLKNYFYEKLDAAGVNYQKISADLESEAVPEIIAIAFPELRAEPLLNILARQGIGVSIGSACSSRKSEQSNVLKSLHLANQLERHVLRISLASSNTEEEISRLVENLANALAKYAIK